MDQVHVEAFGFVPNGGRTYYLNRSQPPLLSDMVRAYLDAALEADDADRAAAALALAERATPLLVTEHDWWTRNKNVQVTANGATYNLLCYRTAATAHRRSSSSSYWVLLPAPSLRSQAGPPDSPAGRRRSPAALSSAVPAAC